MLKRLKIGLVFLLALWAVAFVILGVSRWICPWPWSGECGVEFGRQFEAAVLLLWVDDRETLISAAMAVSAAGASVYYLYRQISQSDAFEKKRTRREHRAARAMLPLALSDVCDFAKGHIQEWLRLYDHGIAVDAAVPGAVAPLLELSFPRVQNESLVTLKEAIRSAPRRKARHFEVVVSQVQVAIARSRGAEGGANDEERRPLGFEAMSQIIELASLYASAARLFNYARRDGPLPEDLEPEPAEIRSALRAMGWREPEGQVIWDRFHQRYPGVAENVVRAP